MGGLREYICGEVRSAIDVFNHNFLAHEGVDFVLKEKDIAAIKFSFGPASTDSIYLHEALFDKDTLKVGDNYKIGRIIGKAYHRLFNGGLFSPECCSADSNRKKRKLERVVEHIFAVLYVQFVEERGDVSNLVNEFHSAGDIPMWSLLDMPDERFDENTGGYLAGETGGEKSKKPGSAREYFLNREHKEAEEEKRIRHQDDLLDHNQQKNFGYDEPDISSSLPEELVNYTEGEKFGDSPLEILHAKERHEEFNIALAVVEGRGDETKNWKRTVSTILRLPPDDDGMRYLSAILFY